MTDNTKYEVTQAATKISNTLAFYQSVIKSGEAWSGTCEAEYSAAQDALSRLTSQPAQSDLVEAVVLRGVGKRTGDGFKDTTTKGEIVFVWNAELQPPYAPGQYPRIGCEGWSASTEQYDFGPATAEDVPAIRSLFTPTATQPDRESVLREVKARLNQAYDGEPGYFRARINSLKTWVERNLTHPTTDTQSDAVREAYQRGMERAAELADEWTNDLSHADTPAAAIRNEAADTGGEA